MEEEKIPNNSTSKLHNHRDQDDEAGSKVRKLSKSSTANLQKHIADEEMQDDEEEEKIEEDKNQIDSDIEDLQAQVIDINDANLNSPVTPLNLKKVARKKQKEPKKKPSVKSKKKREEEPKSKTELWSWEELMSKKGEFTKPSIDKLPQGSDVNTCQLCERKIIKESCIVNTSCMHIYHKECLLNQCKRYLSKSQYPED